MSICVLEQPPERPIILRGGPTREEIRSYVVEHNRRVHEGTPLGYHEHIDVTRCVEFFGYPVISARVFSSEEAYRGGESSGRAVKISDLISPGA